MSNTSKGWGTKGSKFWMQACVYYDDIQKELNRAIGDETIKWLSPLAGDEFTFDEFSLNQKNIPEELKFNKDGHLYDFWPPRQPQWDGIAISGDGKTLYLVEAKAHLAEMASNLSASSDESKNTIKKALKKTYVEYGAPCGNFNKWVKGCYQLGNRMTFLRELKANLPLGQFTDVKLVLLNFVNDCTHKPTSLENWEEHYEKVWKLMLGDKSIPDDIINVFFNVCKRNLAVNPRTGWPIRREDLL